jgi:hypothetical protein
MNSAVVTLALLSATAPPSAAPDVKETIRTGLQWLAKQQNDDGSWSGTDKSVRTLPTATAGLALLMEGSTPTTGAYAPQIRKALGWIEKSAQKNGRLVGTSPSESNQYVPFHAHVLMFLVCAHDADGDPDRVARIAELIKKGIAFTAECQTSRGGWGYLAARDGNDYDDSQSTAVMLQALLAARKAGFDVPKSVTDKAVAYLVRATTPDGGVTYSLYYSAVPQPNTAQPHLTAAAATGVLMSNGARPGALARWVRNARTGNEQLIRNINSNGSFGLFQQCQMARACFALGETGHSRLDPSARGTDLVRWSDYRAVLFKTVKGAQNKDGSWADLYIGTSYSTGLALVILQLDNDFLPAFSR